MPSTGVQPFKICVSDAELEQLRSKLATTRLPTGISESEWGEQNHVTVQFIRDTIKFWQNEYDWREEEAKINQTPQFKTTIDMDDFGPIDVHFIHVTSVPTTNSQAGKLGGGVPLLFLHGWPGSFLEVLKLLDHVVPAGFHVVAPSLPGYGFTSYPNKAGFKFFHHADLMHKLMVRLGYEQYAVQGGDWGSIIARSMALRHPQSVKAVHTNQHVMMPPQFDEQPAYSEFELGLLGRAKWFNDTETAYQRVQSSKPRTLGFALHDSPVGMLAWMADKLLTWSDMYPWSPRELITWTLLHYLPGPTTAMQIYRENLPPLLEMPPEQLPGRNYVACPYGISAFAKEIAMVPRSWVEKENNVVFWHEHASGGHFAAYERPKELAEDMVEFFKAHWQKALSGPE